MSSAGNHKTYVSSIGYRGEHRLWRCYWENKPDQVTVTTGPPDALDALVSFTSAVLNGKAGVFTWEPTA